MENNTSQTNSEVEDYAMQDKLNSAANEATPKPVVEEVQEVTFDDPKKNGKPLLFVIILLAVVGIIVAVFIVFISLPKAGSDTIEVIPDTEDESLESDNFRLESDETVTIDDSEKSSNEAIDDTISDLNTFFEDLDPSVDFENANLNYDE